MTSVNSARYSVLQLSESVNSSNLVSKARSTTSIRDSKMVTSIDAGEKYQSE